MFESAAKINFRFLRVIKCAIFECIFKSECSPKNGSPIISPLGITIISKSPNVITEEKDLNKQLGLTGTAYKLISKILKSYGVESEIITSIGKKLRKAADDGKNWIWIFIWYS